MEINFKFEIGQFVHLKQDIAAWKTLGSKDYGKPSSLMILGRAVEQCAGGCIQIFYAVRLYSEKGSSGTVKFNELELTDSLE